MSKLVIAIGGEPATGKSTLVKALVKRLSEVWGAEPQPAEDTKLVNTLSWIDKNVHVVGKYEEGHAFPGTDRLSMAVQPQAEVFVHSVSDGAVVLFEGDRLFNSSFLNFLNGDPNVNLKAFILRAGKPTLDFRHKDRADTQDEKFLKGRRSKYDNIISNIELMDVLQVINNENEADQLTLILQILEEIKIHMGVY